MDPPSRAPGGAASGSRLGLKKGGAASSSYAPSLPVAPPVISAPAAAPTVSPPPPTSALAPGPLPPARTTAATPSTSAATAATTPMSTVTASPSLPPRPPQAPGWPPQQAPNSWVYPPGCFLNFLQRPQFPQPQQHGENFHLVGQTMSFNPISPPPPPTAYGTPEAVKHEAVKHGTSTNDPVNVDIDEDDSNVANRPVKKRYWSHEEEERLASAWLNASKDPVKGNDKKGDTFWKEVTDAFNKKGNGKRIRETNQLKVHWSRLKSSINDFNGFWSTVTKVNTSGYSDDMLEDEAQKMYAKRYGKPFSLVHWWRILKDEPKWCAQFQETEKDKSEIVDVPDEQSRPIGREAAKAERSGKRKKENIMEGIVILGDNIEKIVKVQQDRKLEREKVTEAQIQISNKNLKAATEQKEAKMFEVYNSLLNQDTSQMSENQKANRDRAIRKIEEKLFAD